MVELKTVVKAHLFFICPRSHLCKIGQDYALRRTNGLFF